MDRYGRQSCKLSPPSLLSGTASCFAYLRAAKCLFPGTAADRLSWSAATARRCGGLFLPMFSEMDSVLDILLFALPGIQLQEDLMDNPLYHNAFCVEEVNRLVGEGVPFRDAYKQVGKAVQEGSFHFSGKLRHSHEGSIGNLCNDRIAERFHRILSTLQKD